MKMAWLNYLSKKKNGIFQFLSKNKHWFFIAIIAYCIADLALLYIRPSLLSGDKQIVFNNEQTKDAGSIAEYTAIWDFHIFHNEDIPPSLSSIREGEMIGGVSPPLSLLPLQLNGTIVYRDEDYSIANITIKGKKDSETYQVNDLIGTLARIVRIGRGKVYFINLNSNKEEYIQVADMSYMVLKFKEEGKKRVSKKASNKLVKKTGTFQFQIERSKINQQLRSLPNILNQARVIPHWENGKMVGYRFKYIKAGSIYEKLGFQVSDIIKSVDGEQVRSELHAAELFHRLKNQSKLDIIIERKGGDIPFSWSINEDVSIEEPPTLRR